MIEVYRTTVIAAIADFICLIVFCSAFPTINPVKIIVFYYLAKIACFSVYRFGGKI